VFGFENRGKKNLANSSVRRMTGGTYTDVHLEAFGI
jgi:hypothetical protein